MEDSNAMSQMSIFIKTCKKDIEWLAYCLRSIDRFLASGTAGVTLVADADCKGELPVYDFEHVYYIPTPSNGYIEQQRIKLLADMFVPETTNYILFVDSDCVFHKPFALGDFLRDGKPLLLRTRYGELGGAEAWKGITESYLGLPVEHEYMRRMPLLYRKDTLSRIRSHYPDLNSRLEILGSRAFSEFNFIGGFIQHFEPHLYSIVNTEDELPEPLCKQFWSWGGLSPTIYAEIESMLQ
jgi:hypothetical protein